MGVNETIVAVGILYNRPCVLFKHKNGYAWYYNGETTDLGDIAKVEAIEKFKRNF